MGGAKTVKVMNLSYFISKFFTHHLTTQRNVSENTVKSYRDTFLQLLTYISETKGMKLERLKVEDITKEIVLDFLDWVEKERGNSIATRNQRLGAIYSFFRFLQSENLDYMLLSHQILSIPLKRKAKPLVHHLEEQELKALLSAIKPDSSKGRRDLALLTLMYDSGGRVQEIIDLTVGDIRFESPATITLTGKGRKTRIVPLMSKTSDLLQCYLDESELSGNKSHILFQNSQGSKLTRNGIAYILDKYANKAFTKETMPQFNITPHVLRHTKAMHLVKADVNIFYIRDILGHTDVTTTEIYARIDVERKRDLLEKISDSAIPSTPPNWKKDKDLLGWLKGLGK